MNATITNLINRLKQSLQSLHLSPTSRKLYLADSKRFLIWLATLDPELLPSSLSSGKSYQDYLSYLETHGVTPSLRHRTLASLKQLGQTISLVYHCENPLSGLNFAPPTSSHDYIKPFINSLNSDHLSAQTIKSYKSDVELFLAWLRTTYSSTPIAKLLTSSQAQKYSTYLTNLHLHEPATIVRKQRSIDRFIAWYTQQPRKALPTDNYSLSNFVRPPTSPTQILAPAFTQRMFSLPSLLTASIFVSLVSAFGYFGYRQLSQDQLRLTQAAFPTPVTPNRQLSFQGRLENSTGTPIDPVKNMVFKLYDDPDLGQGTELYSSGTCSIDPDADGIFNTQIGSTCGSPIGATVFSQNANVYLEVTVEGEVMSPRQQIATVAYALNSETLQGYPISSTVSAITNTVVPMNSSGEIVIGEQSPKLRGVSGTLNISAPSLSLTTGVGTNGNITLAPDGTGQVNLNGNTLTTNFFNISNAQLTTGTLITGTVGSNNSGYKFLDFLGGSSPTSKFSVDATGAVSAAGTINFSGLTGSRALFTDASKNLSSSGTSTMLLDALSDETGSGVAVFGTSPTFTTSILGGASFDLLNTTTTTLNVAGETTTLNLGAGGALTRTINLGTGTGADTINIGTGNTAADDINLGGLITSHVDITGTANFAGGTTYYVDGSGNAKFNDIIAADTGNPGITVGNGSVGFLKVGGSTLSDNDGNLTLSSDSSILDIAGTATASGNVTMGGQLQLGRFDANPTALGAGSMIFNTTSNSYQCYNGSSWYNCAGMLYSNTNSSVADGSYITVTHSLNTNDLLSSAWINSESKWKALDGTYKPAIAWEGKDTENGIYHNEVNLYQGSSETNIYTKNLVESGLLFDTFEDTTKTDSATTTSSFSTQKGDDGSSNYVTLNQRVQSGRTGLIGGQTYNTTTNDNAGNAYLGSNTVNDIYYYDRTRDSIPAVLVELGIDPNWYNGVSLSVATTSAQLSQNETITTKNPNLTTTYNGSLIKATGTDTTPRPTFITIKSPTTFDWTNYQGDAATGVTITPGSAQALGATGVSVTFSNVSYNVGDVFRIASWFIEPASTTRGSKQQFPERSYIIATASSVDIIDADTQKLWMRFNASANSNDIFRALGSSSVTALNGTIYSGIVDNGSNIAGLALGNFVSDAGAVSTPFGYYLNGSISQRNSSIGWRILSSTQALLNNISVNDVAAAVIPNQPTEEVTVSGWGYIQGDGVNPSISETVNLPYKFNSIPQITISGLGVSSTIPTSNTCVATSGVDAQVFTATTNTFAAQLWEYNAATTNASRYYCYNWTATGKVSPKQFVAVATGAIGTDGGITVINETDGAKADVLVGSQHANVIWESKIALTSDGTLYSAYNDDTSDTSGVTVYYGTPGLTSDATWAANYSGGYFVNSAASWSNSGPSILGTKATNQITSLYVTSATSTNEAGSNTIYVGTTGAAGGVSVIQENRGVHGNSTDSLQERKGSVKYYTKDDISEEMIGDIRGMWPLNNKNSASDFEDVSAKANTLTGTNITANGDSVSGVRGTATDFDGSSEYLSCTDASCGGTTKLDFTSTSWSSGAWIYSSNITKNYQMILTKSLGAGGVNDAYEIRTNSTTGKIDLCMYTSAHSCATTNQALANNTWYHIAATYDGAYMRIYINGQLDVATAKTGNMVDSSAEFRIGGRNDGTNTYDFQGSIDEPFVSATILSASQIKHMYEVGYRALQGHATTLGGGAADTNQQLGGTTNTIGIVAPDWNNQFMYVGSNSTTLGAVSKVQLNSDTNIKTYNSSANVPAGGSLLVDEDVTTLGVSHTLELVGSAASGVKTMGLDNNATATSGNFVSKTYTLPKNIASAVIWASPILDSADVSNTLTVQASVDGGSNYATCTLVNTNTNPPVPEREYACTFATSGNSLKVRFAFARGSTKTNTYLTQYGITWLGQTGFRIEQADANNVRLYNYSGETQNLKLNITGSGTTTLANPWTDGGSYLYPTGYESLRVYDGAGSNYLSLSNSGTLSQIGWNGTSAINIDSTGKVGIGTTTPSVSLDVNGSVKLGYLYTTRDSIEINSINTGNRYSFIDFHGDDTNTDYSMRIMRENTGANANSDIVNVGSGSINVIANTNGVYLAAGATSWSASSDSRLKNITGNFTNALNDIMTLNPVHFTWKEDNTNTPQVGLIAQDVQKVLPEAISYGESGYLGVRYTELIPLLTAGIQELNTQVRSFFTSTDNTTIISPLADNQSITITAPTRITPPTNETPTLIVDGEIEATTISARVAYLQNIEVQDLTAKHIVADTITATQITGLDAKIATLAAQMSDTEITTIADQIQERLDALTGNLAKASDIPVATESSNTVLLATSYVATSSADIDFATINQYLAVIGTATITNLEVNDTLAVTTIKSPTHTLALGDTLFVDDDGQVMIKGDLTVSGHLLANSAQINTLTIGTDPLATSSASTSLGNLLAVYNEKGETVATINASGSADFRELGAELITIAAPATATDSSALHELAGTTRSNATAGVATLLSPSTQLTIESPYVNNNSLIYLTPTTNTDNRVLFVKSKDLGKFTVAIDIPASSDISFNWWIIELKQ